MMAPCTTPHRAGIISEEYKRLHSEITKLSFYPCLVHEDCFIVSNRQCHDGFFAQSRFLKTHFSLRIELNLVPNTQEDASQMM